MRDQGTPNDDGSFFHLWRRLRNWAISHPVGAAGVAGVPIALVVLVNLKIGIDFIQSFVTAINVLAWLVQWLGAQQNWVRLTIFVGCCMFVGTLLWVINYFPLTQPMKLTIIALFIFPFIISGVMITQNPGSAEVVSRNIGIIYNSGLDGPDINHTLESQIADLIALYQHGRSEKAHLSHSLFNLSEGVFDLPSLRRFITEENIRYLVVAHPLTREQLSEVLRLAEPYALTIITVPQNAGNFGEGSTIGLYISPETEADHVARVLAGSGAKSVDVFYEHDIDGNQFGLRFRNELNRQLPERINPRIYTFRDFFGGADFGRIQNPTSDVAVISGSSQQIAEMALRLRQLRPGIRILVSGRILDYMTINQAITQNLEVPLPWRLSEMLVNGRGRNHLTQIVAQRFHSERNADTLAAVTLALSIHAAHTISPDSRIELKHLRSEIFKDYDQFSNELRDIYGRVSFAEGSLPHLRVGELKLHKFSEPPEGEGGGDASR